jgi:small-conductance mechanosensitive channel
MQELITTLIDGESAARGTVLSILTIAGLWIAYGIATRGLKRYFIGKIYKPENAKSFLLIWRYIWLALGTVLVIISLSGSLTTLGISAAFIGMILGWSLQAPVTGLAAWLMVIVKRPFRIGDRIIIENIIGDVSDITLTHIILNQVGGTISGEEKSGRGVLIPNAILFNRIIYNYSFESRYILDEVTVLITYESSVEEAEKILIDAAQNATQSIIKATRKEPFVRVEFAESGIRLRVRYQARGTERQKTSSEITHTIIKGFNKTSTVEFAYPHLEVLHRGKQKTGTS